MIISLAGVFVKGFLEIACNDYSYDDFHSVVKQLPQEGIETMLHKFSWEFGNRTKSTEENRTTPIPFETPEDFWDKCFLPFWNNVFPKDKKYKSKNLSETMIDICVHSGKRFPLAVNSFKDWIDKGDYHQCYALSENLCSEYPDASLTLLDAAVETNIYGSEHITKCLDAIKAARSELSNEPHFQRLENMIQ